MLVLSPGPGICDEDVLCSLKQPCRHHREECFKQIYTEIVENMKCLLHAPYSELIIMNGSGSTGMESAVRNLITKHDHVLSIRCGYFSNRFYQMAANQDCTMYNLDYPKYDTYQIEDVEWMLHHHPINTVLVTHCETETGSLQDLSSLGKLCEQAHVLLLVDSISGVVMNEVSMEKMSIDCLIMASQKGFLLPPGLCMIALSPKAIEKMKTIEIKSYVFDFKTILQKYHDDARIHCTPNISFYIGLHIALKKLNSTSSELLAAYYSDLHDMLKEELIKLGFTILPKHESNSLLVCRVPPHFHAKEIQRKLEQEGIRIETGLQDEEDNILRIGIMNAVKKEHLTTFLRKLRMVLHET